MMCARRRLGTIFCVEERKRFWTQRERGRDWKIIARKLIVYTDRERMQGVDWPSSEFRLWKIYVPLSLEIWNSQTDYKFPPEVIPIFLFLIGQVQQVRKSHAATEWIFVGGASRGRRIWVRVWVGVNLMTSRQSSRFLWEFLIRRQVTTRMSPNEISH